MGGALNLPADHARTPPSGGGSSGLFFSGNVLPGIFNSLLLLPGSCWSCSLSLAIDRGRENGEVNRAQAFLRCGAAIKSPWKLESEKSYRLLDQCSVGSQLGRRREINNRREYEDEPSWRLQYNDEFQPEIKFNAASFRIWPRNGGNIFKS